MRVRDLIADSVWTPGASYTEAAEPLITVILPTFRRGKNGLFKLSAQSILRQSLHRIELIVIDDASIDGTADQILELQKIDPRVHCIRHLRNIGLPAISELEGYRYARGKFIAFAFDDTEFNHDALEALLRQADLHPGMLIVGRVVLALPGASGSEGSYSIPDTLSFSSARLELTNYLPNCGVLMDRRIIEDVGLYDPHVSMTRLCDWDLWRRVARRHPIQLVDVEVGVERGLTTNDSLGATHSMDSWAIAERMAVERREQLLPASMLDLDVFEPHRDANNSTRDVCQDYAWNYLKQHPWLPPESVRQDQNLSGSILVVAQSYDASVALCFGFLPESVKKNTRILIYPGSFSPHDLCRASCLIVVRAIDFFRPCIDVALALKIPVYYYLDDHLPLLTECGEIDIEGENFRPEVFRENISRFSGVLLTSPALVDNFRRNLFHKNISFLPICIKEQQELIPKTARRHENRPIVIAGLFGPHRMGDFKKYIYPALRKLADDGHHLQLLIPQFDEGDALTHAMSTPNIELVSIKYIPDYLDALRSFAKHTPDFFLTPGTRSRNSIFKTLHPVLSARLMDAVPVLPSTLPYAAISGIGNAALVGKFEEPLAWYEVLTGLIASTEARSEILKKNRQFCRIAFSGSRSRQVLQEVLQASGGEVSWPEQSRRAQQLGKMQSAGFPTTATFKQKETTLHQLAEYRRALRNSKRMHLFRRRDDLWDSLRSDFDSLKNYTKRIGWRVPGATLELGESLHFHPYEEHCIKLTEGQLDFIDLAFASDTTEPQGEVGIELIDESNVIRFHVRRSFSNLDIHRPVRFFIKNIEIHKNENWRLRIFSQSEVPVYMFELVRRRWFGLQQPDARPLIGIGIKER